MNRRDEGSVTLWVIGLTLMIGMLGLVVWSLYAPFSERRELAAAADQAAQAGATAFDTEWFRSTGQRQLNPGVARDRAIQNLTAQAVDFDPAQSTVTATVSEVTVVLVKQADAPLLEVLADNEGPLVISVTATGTLKQD